MSNRMLEEFVGDAKSNHKLWVDRLSDRELEVFRFIGQGQGTRRIAEKLHLSIKTIECYREHIKEKMMFTDASELVHHAIRWVEKNTLCKKIKRAASQLFPSTYRFKAL
jgi:DNA-binding NarL/FixJ family response regulator